MASNTATAVATTLIGAACGLLGGLALGGRGSEPASLSIDSVAPRQQAAPLAPSPIEARLDELQQGLADVKSLVAGLASSDDRTPIVADSPASTTTESSAADSDSDKFHVIEVELAAIRDTIKEQVWVQSPPTIEQLRRTPVAPMWTERNAFAELARTNETAARESVLGLSYDEVLSKLGRPSVITQTKWWYLGPQGSGGFQLEFVNGFVGQMRSSN